MRGFTVLRKIIEFDMFVDIYRRFHGDVTRRVTWPSGTTGWQKICGLRAPRVFLLGFMPCLHSFCSHTIS